MIERGLGLDGIDRSTLCDLEKLFPGHCISLLEFLCGSEPRHHNWVHSRPNQLTAHERIIAVPTRHIKNLLRMPAWAHLSSAAWTPWREDSRFGEKFAWYQVSRHPMEPMNTPPPAPAPNKRVDLSAAAGKTIRRIIYTGSGAIVLVYEDDDWTAINSDDGAVYDIRSSTITNLLSPDEIFAAGLCNHEQLKALIANEKARIAAKKATRLIQLRAELEQLEKQG